MALISKDFIVRSLSTNGSTAVYTSDTVAARSLTDADARSVLQPVGNISSGIDTMLMNLFMIALWVLRRRLITDHSGTAR